jgi:hypothetical protein
MHEHHSPTDDQASLGPCAQVEQPLKGIRKFRRDMEVLREQLHLEDRVRLCTADPALTFHQARSMRRLECLHGNHYSSYCGNDSV